MTLSLTDTFSADAHAAKITTISVVHASSMGQSEGESSRLGRLNKAAACRSTTAFNFCFPPSVVWGEHPIAECLNRANT
jgi:hypothetical protein